MTAATSHDLLFGSSHLVFLRRLHHQPGFEAWQADPANDQDDPYTAEAGNLPPPGHFIPLRWWRDEPTPALIEGFVFPAAPAARRPQRWYAWDHIRRIINERRASATHCYFQFGAVDLDFSMVALLGREELDPSNFIDRVLDIYLTELELTAGDIPTTLLGVHPTSIEDDGFDQFLHDYKMHLPLYEGLRGEALLDACPNVRFAARQNQRMEFNRRLKQRAHQAGYRYLDIFDEVSELDPHDGLVHVTTPHRVDGHQGDVHLNPRSLLSHYRSKLELVGGKP